MSHLVTLKHLLVVMHLAFLSTVASASTPAGATAPETVRVLASIKPLALIAREVVGDRGSVEVLLPVAASPHDYPLKVSDMQRLREASLVLWIGPELEGFLQRPLRNHASTQQMSAYHLPGLHWPDEKNATAQGDVTSHHHHDENHQHHAQDPHLWLDPRNGVAIARALAARLAELNPSSGEFYLANAERFAQAVDELDGRLMMQLKPVAKTGFAVYHEGYLHFVARYQLQQVGFVTYSPERRPGARHLYQLRKVLKGQASCLFTEPYYDQSSARELSEELNLRIGVLDPIGGEHINTYSELLEVMARDFVACLAP